MPSITFQKVSFSYESPFNEVFSELDLLIDTGWRAGLVGKNGAGKSTLLGLIGGLLSPQAGHIERPEIIRLFPPKVPLKGQVRDVVREAVMPYASMQHRMAQLLEVASEDALSEYALLQESFQHQGGYELDARLDAEFEMLELSADLMDRPFESLSGGEQTRCLIAGLFAGGEGYTLIDEPTNHLDVQGREQLSRYLHEKSGYLLVSHDRRFLDETINHVISINKADVRVTRGNFSVWRQNMDNELRREARTRENIEREVKQLKKSARQRRDGAERREADKYGTGGEGVRDTGFIGHRAAKQMKRALTAERRIDSRIAEKQELLRNQEKERQLKIVTSGPVSGPLVNIQDVTVNGLFRNLSFQIGAGDRIALTGKNGCGKSTLLNLVCGDLSPDGGIVARRPGMRIARVYQQPRWQAGKLKAHLDTEALDETRFRQLLGVLGVSGDIFDRDLATFSEGQRKKVEFARSLIIPCDLLVWDEPLNYIDLMSREQIEQAVRRDHPTILFVEHDRQFVQSVGTREIVLGQGNNTPPSTSMVEPVI